LLLPLPAVSRQKLRVENMLLMSFEKKGDEEEKSKAVKLAVDDEKKERTMKLIGLKRVESNFFMTQKSQE
jgi:hypothetical protein